MTGQKPPEGPEQLAGGWHGLSSEDETLLDLFTSATKKTRAPEDIEEMYLMEYGDSASAENLGGYHQRGDLLVAAFRPQPAVIYHPGCRGDLSAAKRNPHARVIHLDQEDSYMRTMTDGGYEAYTGDHNLFIPEVLADVVILFNAGVIPNDQLKKVTKADALVVVNNYHLAATFMAQHCPDFELVGAVQGNEPQTVVRDINIAKLGTMPTPDEELSWPPHSETIFAFQRHDKTAFAE